ncbi:inositol monophosphatase family protein [Corynebacterium mastitidis]
MTDHHEPMTLCRLAQEWVERAARAIAAKRAELGDVRAYALTKSSPVDPVTVVDTMAEEMLVAEIRRRHPGDGIIAEEGSQERSTTGVSWIIDPIDGTVNFLYGLPHYAVSLAAAIDGEVVAGAVINVADGSLYYAARGCGAWVRAAGEPGAGERLRVSGATSLDRALVATGFSYRAERRARQADALGRLLPEVRDIRRQGSAALDLCAVAQGRVDAYYEHGIHCWDYAAGMVIAREDGAVVDAPALSVPGEEGRRTLAATPGVAEELARLLDEAGAGASLNA